jgi:hypothetical protein
VILSLIEQRIKAKIEAVGTPLKDWDIQINYGIKTGFNEAFIISGEKRKELIEQDPKSEEIIRPILRGRDIKRYGYDFADLWLINTHNGIKEKGIKPININDYPAIKHHLDNYFPELEKRQDKGETPYNLRNCAYIEDFYKQKIVWSDISTEPSFVFIDEPIFFNNTCYMMTNVPVYVEGILNSKITKWYFPKIATDLGSGGTRYFKQFVELLPIPKCNENVKQTIINSIENKDYNKIDVIFYSLLQLNAEEINFINAL